MKITHIKSWVENLDLIRPYKIATRLISDVQNVFVEVMLEDGTIGYGAASPAMGVTGESLDHCLNQVDPNNLRWLYGESLDNFAQLESLCEHLNNTLINHAKQAAPAGCAAVDIALHDAYGKVHQQCLVDVFGRKLESLPTSITIGIKNVAETLKEADEYLARHFTVIKVKLGDDVTDDIARLKALRAVHGNRITLRVDMNQGYDLVTFEHFLSHTADLNIEFMEQPFSVAQTSNFMAKIKPEHRALIALDESLVSVEHALRLAQENKPGIFNIKLMKCGGLYAARKIAKIAKDHDIDLMWGCNDESRISISAALNTAYSCSNTQYIDLDGSLDLAHDIVECGFSIEDGIMRTAEGPGLGVNAVSNTTN